MKTLVLGATGYIGSRVVARLLIAGHEVVGSARNAGGLVKVKALGAATLLVDLDDGPDIEGMVAAFDAVIFAPQLTQDREYEVAHALLAAMAGTGKTFIFTSGTGVLGQRTNGDWSEETFAEDDEFPPNKYLLRRIETERLVRDAAACGVRAIVMRPPSIWGDGYHGFVDRMLQAIEKTGTTCYIGRGLNLYTHVHVEDLAELYRLVLERGEAGALYHSVGGELNNRTIAEYVARNQGVEAVSITPEQAVDVWGKFAMLVVLGASSRSRSPRARRELGWTPQHVDLGQAILDGQLNRRR